MESSTEELNIESMPMPTQESTPEPAPEPIPSEVEEEIIFSTNPFDYLDVVEEVDIVEETDQETNKANKDEERAFFNFYENPEIQKNIYETIAEDIRNPRKLDILILNTQNKNLIFTGCNEDMFIKRSRFVIKNVNEIICSSDNNTINGYLNQTKLDWNRVSKLRPIYSSKYNKFFSVKTNQSYVTEKNNNKQYLTIVNALFNFLLSDSAEEEDEFQIVGDLTNPELKKENIEFTDAIGKTSCNCQIVYREGGEKITKNCKSFTKFNNLPIKTLDILYKLLIIFQSSAVVLVEALNNYLNNVRCKYDRLSQNTGCKPTGFMYFDSYYYFDGNNNSLVSVFKIFLQIEGDLQGKSGFIPFYKVINVYPLKKYNYCYSFFYIDNDPPYGDGKYNSKLEQIDVFKLIEKRIKIYLGLNVENFTGLFYSGEDLKIYQKTKATSHRVANKAKVISKIGGQPKNKGKINRKRQAKKNKTKKINKNKRTRKIKNINKYKNTRKNNKNKKSKRKNKI